MLVGGFHLAGSENLTPPAIKSAVQELLRTGVVEAEERPKVYDLLRQRPREIAQALEPLDEAISALAQTDAVRADIVVARFFAGRSTEEIAADLGMSERSVLRHWAAAKVWLYRWMQEADKAQT